MEFPRWDRWDWDRNLLFVVQLLNLALSSKIKRFLQYNEKLPREKYFKIIFLAINGCVSIKTLADINQNQLYNIEKQDLTITIQSGIKSEKYGVVNFNTRKASDVSTHLYYFRLSSSFHGICLNNSHNTVICSLLPGICVTSRASQSRAVKVSSNPLVFPS